MQLRACQALTPKQFCKAHSCQALVSKLLRKKLLTKMLWNKKLNRKIASKVLGKLLVVLLLVEGVKADWEDLVHKDLLCKVVLKALVWEAMFEAPL